MVGLREDGSVKLRSIDDLTAGRVNGCTQPTEKLHNDNIDQLFRILQALVKATGCEPVMLLQS